MGFRPVTAADYLANHMDLPKGASPVVMTFDDADPTQFTYLPDGTIDPNCAVAIWVDFEKTHPDFPLHATFFVLPSMFGQPALAQKKIEFLRAQGAELACHTINHPKLNTLTDDKVEYEFGAAIDMLAKDGFTNVPLALPFGIFPKNHALVKSFEWQGRPYHLTGTFLVGANPAPSPNSPKFDAYKVPRIQGIDLPFGITFWLDKLAKGEVHPYVQP